MLYPPKRALLALATLVTLTMVRMATAQPAPSGAHPRIWLDGTTLANMKAQSSVANGAVARGATRCNAARTVPSEYSMGGWQGFEFVTTLSGCLVSWEATGNADDLATAVKYWNVLLDDYQNVGDGGGGDTVVTHDTGYAMRTFAPYSAIAYDWLHDAPGVTENLRAHARARFDAWVNYYATSGYLRHVAGSNYQAGYAFAATLIAIAEGGEAGSSGDSHWATVRDGIWGTDLAAGLRTGGVLDGGDWPEGWQYGPLSVLEHALAARAMGDNGAPVAGIGPWANSLVLRFAHGLTPASHKTFTAGDVDITTPNLEPTNGVLLAAIAGPGNEQSRAWARKFNADLGLRNENPLFDALAAARAGASEAIPATAPTSYLTAGTGNWYVRGAWAKNTVWSVFQCSRRLVDDHQHNDAGNWVFTRGADDVVVDPSPYGSLSSLTGNAPAVDSAVLPSGYSPSQANWGQTTRLTWAKQSVSGIGVARCDYADQFKLQDVPSDVAHAIRDFVLVPNGDSGAVVLVDRVVTGEASRALHLRVRSPSALALGGNAATATVGASTVTIQKLWSTSGTPSVRDMPLSPECSSLNRGTCDITRLPSGQEYRLDVDGPSAGAIHVVGARALGAPAPSNVLLSGSGYRGVLLGQPASPVAVIMNDTADGAPGSSLAYRVPVGKGATHVVVDAPVDANGRSDVTGKLDGTDCAITVAPRAGATGGFDGRGLVVRVSNSCAVTEDGSVAPIDPGAAEGTGGARASSGGAGGMVSTSSGGANSGGTIGGGTSSGGRAASNPNAGGAAGNVAGSSAAMSAGSASSSAGSRSAPDGGPAESGSLESDSSCTIARKTRKYPFSPFVVGALVFWLGARRRRSPKLQGRFPVGPASPRRSF